MKLGMLGCLLGWHDIYSWADSPDTMLLPTPGDSTDVILWKFRETTKLRCRNCTYTYEGR